MENLLSSYRLSMTEIRRYWKERLGYIKTYCHQYFASNGVKMSLHVEDVFFKYLLRKFNRLGLRNLADKNYDRLFSGAKTPAAVVHNINGNFYDEEYNALDEHKAVRMVWKPSRNKGCGETFNR